MTAFNAGSIKTVFTVDTAEATKRMLAFIALLDRVVTTAEDASAEVALATKAGFGQAAASVQAYSSTVSVSAASANQALENAARSAAASAARISASVNAAVAATNAAVAAGAAGVTAAAAQAAAGATRIGGAIAGIQGGLSRAGGAVGGIASIAGAVIGFKIGEEAAEFDRAMANIRAIVRETEEEFKGFRAETVRLAADLRFSAVEAAHALTEIVQAGFHGRDAMLLLETALKGARAGFTTTAIASNAIIQVINAFGLKAEESAATMGKLVRAVDLGVFSFAQLAQSIGSIAPQARVMGVGLDELLPLLTTLTRKDANLDEVVTQLRGTFNELVHPQKEAKEAMEAVLGTTVEAAIRTRGFTATLKTLIASTNGSAEALSALFPNIRAFNAVAKLGVISTEELATHFEQISQSGGAALNRMFEIQNASLYQLVEAFGALLKVGVVDFYERHRAAINGTVSELYNYLRANKELVGNLVTALVALAAVSAAGLALRLAFTGLSVVTGIFGAGLAAVGGIARAAAGVGGLAGLTQAATGLAFGLRLVNAGFAAIAANGAGIIGAVRLAGTGIAAMAVSAGGLAAALGSVLAAALPLLVALAAIVGVAKVAYDIGRTIGLYLQGITREEIALTDALAARAKMEHEVLDITARRAKQAGVDEGKVAAEQLTAKYKELVVAVREYAGGNVHAAETIRRLNTEIAALQVGNQSTIDKLTGRKAELDGIRDTRRAKLRGEGKGADDVAVFTDFASDTTPAGKGHDAKAVELAAQLIAEYRELTGTIEGLKRATSDATSQQLKLLEAEGKLKAIVTGAEDATDQTAKGIGGVVASAHAAGLTDEQKKREKLAADQAALDAARISLQEQRGAIENAGGDTGEAGSKALERIRIEEDRVVAAHRDIAAQIEGIDKEIADKKAKVNREAEDEIETAEIALLQKGGKFREAEDRAAALRHRKAIDRATELQDIDDAHRRQLIDGINRAYAVERAAADDNDRKRFESTDAGRKLKESLEKAQKRADAEHEAALIRQDLEAAKITGNAREQLRLQGLLAKTLKEANDTKGEELLKDQELVAAARERLGLLKEEINTKLRLGDKPGELGGAIRGAERDIVGADSAEGFRGAARKTFRGVGDTGSLQQIVDAVKEALTLEFQDNQKSLAAAVKSGDPEAIAKANRDQREIYEKARILIEEQNRAAKEIGSDTGGGRARPSQKTVGEAKDALERGFQESKAAGGKADAAPDGKLNPAQEKAFQAAYAKIVAERNAAGQPLDANPDAPEHKYDYRAAFKAGKLGVDESGHFPSEFKAPDHDRRYLEIDGVTTDTSTGKPAGADVKLTPGQKEALRRSKIAASRRKAGLPPLPGYDEAHDGPGGPPAAGNAGDGQETGSTGQGTGADAPDTAGGLRGANSDGGLGGAITGAAGAVTGAIDGLGTALGSLASAVTAASDTVLKTLDTIGGKLADAVEQVNGNTAAIAALGGDAANLRIEGRTI